MSSSKFTARRSSCSKLHNTICSGFGTYGLPFEPFSLILQIKSYFQLWWTLIHFFKINLNIYISLSPSLPLSPPLALSLLVSYSPFPSMKKFRKRKRVHGSVLVERLHIIVDMWFQVLKESFKIYCAVNDGIINLIDKVSSFYYLCIFI